jgi:hypothetical protein
MDIVADSMESENPKARHKSESNLRGAGIFLRNLDEIEVTKEDSSTVLDKVLQKRADQSNYINSNVPASARDRFEMTNMSVQEATDRYKTTERNRHADGQSNDDALCFICFSNDSNVVFLDCGHGGRPFMRQAYV